MPQLQRLKAREILARDAPAIYLLATKETVGMSFKVHGIADLPLGVVYADRDTWKEKESDRRQSEGGARTRLNDRARRAR